MYIDENNPNIFDDIFALLLHFNEYTSLIIFIEKKWEENTTQDKSKKRRKSVVPKLETSWSRRFILKKVHSPYTTRPINALDTK